MQKLPLFALCLGLVLCTEYNIDSNFLSGLFTVCLVCLVYKLAGLVKMDNVDNVK